MYGMRVIEREGQVTEPKCTYCGGTEFYAGPEGGLSMNVLCANPDCRHWFNDTPMGFEDLRQIEPTEEERMEQAAIAATANTQKVLDLYHQGADLAKDHGLALACISDARRHGKLTTDDLIRLAGWLDHKLGGKYE